MRVAVRPKVAVTIWALILVVLGFSIWLSLDTRSNQGDLEQEVQPVLTFVEGSPCYSDPGGRACQRTSAERDRKQSVSDACIQFRTVDHKGELLALTKCQPTRGGESDGETDTAGGAGTDRTSEPTGPGDAGGDRSDGDLDAGGEPQAPDDDGGSTPPGGGEDPDTDPDDDPPTQSTSTLGDQVSGIAGHAGERAGKTLDHATEAVCPATQAALGICIR